MERILGKIYFRVHKYLNKKYNPLNKDTYCYDSLHKK